MGLVKAPDLGKGRESLGLNSILGSTLIVREEETMVESLVLIEGREQENLDEEALRGISLSNAKQVVVGRTPRGRVIVHVAANTLDDLRQAFLDLIKVPGVSSAVTLTLRSGGGA